MSAEQLNLADLKAKTPAELLAMAEEWDIEKFCRTDLAFCALLLRTTFLVPTISMFRPR